MSFQTSVFNKNPDHLPYSWGYSPLDDPNQGGFGMRATFQSGTRVVRGDGMGTDQTNSCDRNGRRNWE